MASSESPPGLSPTSGVWSVQELEGLKTYVTGPQDSNLAILLISAVSGYEPPKLSAGDYQNLSEIGESDHEFLQSNAKPLLFHYRNGKNDIIYMATSFETCRESCVTPVWKVADKVSANGFLVVVPDFFSNNANDDPKLDRGEWLKAHGKDKGCGEAKAVISALRSKGVTSKTAGFCWGGKVVVKLASSDYIQGGVALHPGRVTEDEINEVKCPISILGAEIDEISPPELLKQFGEILSAKPGVGDSQNDVLDALRNSKITFQDVF